MYLFLGFYMIIFTVLMSIIQTILCILYTTDFFGLWTTCMWLVCYLWFYLSIFSLVCKIGFSWHFTVNICLNEDILKISWRRLSSSASEDVFKTSSRCLDQDEYSRLMHTSSEDVLIKTNIFVLAIRLQDIFKTF